MPGWAALLMLGCCSCQCAVTNTIAWGFSGKLPGMLRRKSAILSQVSAGCHSMKKHGPAPCGTKKVGMRWGEPGAEGCDAVTGNSFSVE